LGPHGPGDIAREEWNPVLKRPLGWARRVVTPRRSEIVEHHPSLEDRVKELARLLGIAVGEQLHRALEVGEKDGEAKPAVALEGDPGPSVRPDATWDPWIGQAIKARYQVSRQLAAGPSGNLYIAHDGETGAEVTIKLLPAGTELDDDRVRRLRDDLPVTRAVARIRPNVAIVHDCDRTPDGRAFLVLEPLDGRSLADVIGQEGALPVERALRLAFEIADGLLAAHNLVFVHGALDAEHVLIGAKDTVKLTGFEVARLGGAGLNAGGLTEQADIQALGLLLMHMLTGAVRPRSEGSDAHPERTLGRDVPASVREFVMQALVRAPEPQAPDMGAVVNALWVELNRVTERPVADPPMADRPIPAVEGPVRAVWPRARWRTVGIGALVVAVIALGAWVTRYRATDPPPVAPGIHATPAAQSPRVPSAGIPEPAAVGRPAEVVVTPPVPPSVSRTQRIPPTQPATQARPRARGTPPPASERVRTPPPAPAERAEATSRVRVRPAPESSASRQESRPERETSDASAIIDWLLKESPPRQR
jgi:serine/threonine protein kinase